MWLYKVLDKPACREMDVGQNAFLSYSNTARVIIFHGIPDWFGLERTHPVHPLSWMGIPSTRSGLCQAQITFWGFLMAFCLFFSVLRWQRPLSSHQIPSDTGDPSPSTGSCARAELEGGILLWKQPKDFISASA